MLLGAGQPVIPPLGVEPLVSGELVNSKYELQAHQEETSASFGFMRTRGAGNPPPCSSSLLHPLDPINFRRRLLIDKEEMKEKEAAFRLELDKTLASFKSEMEKVMQNVFDQFRLGRTSQLTPPPSPAQQPPKEHSSTPLSDSETAIPIVHSHLWKARCKEVARTSMRATGGVKKPHVSKLGASTLHKAGKCRKLNFRSLAASLLLKDAISAQSNLNLASVCLVSDTGTSIPNLNFVSTDCVGVDSVLVAKLNGSDVNFENGEDETSDRKAKVYSGDVKELSELDSVSVKQDDLQGPNSGENGRECHALHLLDEMPQSKGLCSVGGTVATLTSIRDKGGGLAHQPVDDGFDKSVGNTFLGVEVFTLMDVDNGLFGEENAFMDNSYEKMHVNSKMVLELILEKWKSQVTVETQSQANIVQWLIFYWQPCHCETKGIVLFCMEAFDELCEMFQNSLSQGGILGLDVHARILMSYGKEHRFVETTQLVMDFNNSWLMLDMEAYATLIGAFISGHDFQTAFVVVLSDLSKLFVVIFSAFNDNAGNLLTEDTVGIVSDHHKEDWRVIHAWMYEKGIYSEFVEKPEDRKLEALIYANLRIDDAAYKLIAGNIVFCMCAMHSLTGQIDFADSLSSMLGVYHAIARFSYFYKYKSFNGELLGVMEDSLNKNQRESSFFAQSVIPFGRMSLVKNGPHSVLRIEDYSATLKYKWETKESGNLLISAHSLQVKLLVNDDEMVRKGMKPFLLKDLSILFSEGNGISFLVFVKTVESTLDMELVFEKENGYMVIDHTIIEKKVELELMNPEKFRSSISLEFMKDLVTLASWPTYDEGNLIAQWMSLEHQTCLKSGQKLIHMVYVSNYALKSLLHHWCVEFHALVSCSRDFVIAIMGGKKMLISKHEGKMVALYFSFSTCSPCIEFTLRLVGIYEKVKAKEKSFEILLILLDEAEETLKPDFKKLPWFTLAQKDTKTCANLTWDSELSNSPILVIIGTDAENIHNNVAEANAYIDGKMYDFSVIMQWVMISSTRPLDELKGNLCIVSKYISKNIQMLGALSRHIADIVPLLIHYCTSAFEKNFAGVHEVSVVSWNVNLLATCVKSDEEIQPKVRVHALEKKKDKRTKVFTAGQTLMVLTVVGMHHSSSFGFLTGTEKYVEAEKVCVDDEVANHASTEAHGLTTALLLSMLIDGKRCKGHHVVIRIAALKIYLFWCLLCSLNYSSSTCSVSLITET